jgi:hypothetical protein
MRVSRTSQACPANLKVKLPMCEISGRLRSQLDAETFPFGDKRILLELAWNDVFVNVRSDRKARGCWDCGLPHRAGYTHDLK